MKLRTSKQIFNDNCFNDRRSAHFMYTKSHNEKYRRRHRTSMIRIFYPFIDFKILKSRDILLIVGFLCDIDLE